MSNFSELFQLKSAGVLNFSELFQLKKAISAQSREEAARGAEEPLPPALVIECHKC